MFTNRVLIQCVCYLASGIWGSAFTILLQRMLNEDQHPMATAEKTVIKGDGRAELSKCELVYIHIAILKLLS